MKLAVPACLFGMERAHMKTCKQLQAVVEALCAKHELDLKQVGAHLRLENDPYEPLVIERIAEHQVSVAHYYVQNGDAIADPDVVVFTGYAEWVPISIQQPIVCLAGRELGGYHVVAELTDDGNNIARFYPRAQPKTASFCKTWARNLKAQGWLEHAVRAES
jgi:Domain of unknown function (DUF6908)